MNILWIEDFGHLQPDSPTLINFFGGLIPHTAFDNHWSQETRLRDVPATLKAFFEQYSETHDLTLLRHYGDFLDLTQSCDLVSDHDVVAIDINLSSGVPKDIPLPEGHADPDAFHKKAGFYIYNQLIRIGFPDDHICFLTGEKESTFKEFTDHCQNALMPLPKVFGKDDAGMADFRCWLDEHRKSSYMTLRRGVIEGCKHLRQNLSDTSAPIQFNLYRTNEDQVSAASMDDHLSSLMRFLPPKPPAKGELTRTLRLFARALAHEWESKVKPSDSGNTVLRSLGWVMKETRNCLAHSQSLDRLTPPDLAYLVLVGMRAMFALRLQPMRFEAVLLSCFEQSSWPAQDQIDAALRDSHARLLDAFMRGGGDKISRNFRELANKAEEQRTPGIDYVVLLYQILWHQLAQRGKVDNATDYRCDSRPQTFGEEGSFLNRLMKSIHRRSFPR